MKNWIIFGIIALLGISCEKIIAEDISGITPTVIVPTVNDTVTSNPVLFKWDPITGADSYRLEVVSPSFASITTFTLDSFIPNTEFTFPLDSNEYEFRLTATNGAYDSQVAGPFKFWVGVSPAGGGNSVSLIAPSDGAYVDSSFNVSSIFSWNALVGASSYEFSLRKGSSFADGVLLNTETGLGTLIHNEQTINFTEGVYFWGVKAFIGTTETPYSIRQLNVDMTDPNVPVLSTPTDQQFVNAGTITFNWNNGSDPGTVNSPVNSFIEIASDINFTNVVESGTVQDSGTTSFDLTAGNYFWRVTNTDEAGNSAAASNVFQLDVN